MIKVIDKEIVLEKYSKIIKCWLLTKIKGRKGKTYPNGHRCNSNDCVICESEIEKYDFKSLRQEVILYIEDIIENDKLILGKPEEILLIYQKFKQKNLAKKEEEIIKYFFKESGYKWFQKNFGKDFLNDLDINTCLYCNRNYILQIVDNRANAQLDHWFPKGTFYILALSLYNLIPSCSSCNHIKLTGKEAIKKLSSNQNLKDDEINQWWLNEALNKLNHPYLDNHNFRFSYEYKSLDDFNLKIDVEKDSKTDSTLKFNRIEEIYNAHSNLELKDLVHLRSKYSDTFLNMVSNNFEGIVSKEEAYRIIFGVEEKAENFHKRPFSKFKTDIIDELLNDNKSKFES